MILQQDRKLCWKPVWELILLCAMFFMSRTCESYEGNETCQLQNLLFISTKPTISHTCYFPTDTVVVGGRKLCFSIDNNERRRGCCNDKEFNCNFNISHIENDYFLFMSEEMLSVQDVVLMKNPDDFLNCPPSKLYDRSGSLFNIHKCLDRGVKNIRLSQNLCGNKSPSDPEINNHLSVENGKVHCGSYELPEPPPVSALVNLNFTSPETALFIMETTTALVNESTNCSTAENGQCGSYKQPDLTPVSVNHNITSPETAQLMETTTALVKQSTNCSTVEYGQCGSYKPAGQVLCPDPTQKNNTDSGTWLEDAQNIIKNTTTLLEGMTKCSTATIQTDQIRGIVTKLPSGNHSDIIFGVTTSTIHILGKKTDSTPGMKILVKISREASEVAVRGNGSFIGIFLIPAGSQVNSSVPGLSFLNDQVVGIEMGAEISNLSETVDIYFKNVDETQKGNVASCRSWDGKGKEPLWVKDGCHTKVENGSITCQCSHLTFFGILLSAPPGNISSTDLTSLTYITNIGCGLSLFFLAAAIFMHCLIRKRKASQATEILMNLFVAMFSLNLTFLVNDKIADVGSLGACVAIAAFLHYTMLATMTWFFMEALHLYFNMWKIPSEVKHYMVKMCIAGWVTPVVVVIPLLAKHKYGFLVISADDGTSAKMCWIPDAAVHQGTNISYYAIVFVFTFSIFVLTVRQICLLKPKQNKTQTLRSNTLSVLSLLLLLGITWAFAFFSYGPLRIPSFYIFTILNSFQGFFLFIYYYKSSKSAGESSSSTASNTAVSSLNQ